MHLLRGRRLGDCRCSACSKPATSVSSAYLSSMPTKIYYLTQKREDSLLPGRVREILGLPTYRDRDRLASYYFDVLVKGAKEVCISLSRTTDRRSHVLWKKSYGSFSSVSGQTDSSRSIRSLQYRWHLENRVPEPVAKSLEIAEFLGRFTYSATAIDTYLVCPLRFYYRYVLRIAERLETAGEMGQGRYR